MTITKKDIQQGKQETEWRCIPASIAKFTQRNDGINSKGRSFR